MQNMKTWQKLSVSLLLPLAVGGVAGLFTQPEITGWFRTIRKPAWQPPNWLFAPVWTLLYIFMGLALYLVWKNPAMHSQKRAAVLFWSVQLLFNFLWSFIFFKQHQIGLALADILLLWLFILLTIFAFAKTNRAAAWLLVPYISWVSFAAMLNLAILQLNR